MQHLAMALCASVMPSRSSLNPNAPTFIPAAFFAAEDFSPEWWHLVHTCPAFREYWLSECFDPDQQQMQDFSEDLDLFGEDAFFTDLELVFLDAYRSVLFKKEESLPPFPSLDVREFARKAGLNELSVSPKHSRRQFSPLAYYVKPPKVVAAARPQKHVLRKIQQPRS